jgi:uncharacterized protein YceK
MRKSLAGGLIAFALILVSGCSSTSSLTALSTKNVNLADMKLDRTRLKGHGTGQDCVRIFVVVPTGGVPNIKEAIDRAVESLKGNVLLDARVEYKSFYIPLIYGETCWTVEGDVYDTF